MRKVTSHSWGRMALALAAFLAVAGPGFVLAQGPGTSYARPVLICITGPTTAIQGGPAVGPYTAEVDFSDGSHGENAVVSWSALNGSVTTTSGAATDFSLTGTKGLVKAKYCNEAGCVAGSFKVVAD